LKFKPQKTLEMLKQSEIERPYVVQLFGSESKYFALASKLITEKIKPDGIDINFGCPVKKIQKQGAGAVLMNKPKLAKDIIKATIENTDLPVSIKTRIQVEETDVLQFLAVVGDLNIKALMVHGRTMGQGFSGPIDLAKIKKTRDYFDGVLMANGGIFSKADADRVLAETGADGLGLAQGVLGKPWLFEEVKNDLVPEKSRQEVFEIALKHARLVRDIVGEKGMLEMRKHLCWYMKGIEGAGELRKELIRVECFEDAEKALSL
jgi:nifR3 family TIM-barrel protein